MEDTKSARVFMLISTAGHIALFPLLYQPAGELYKTQSHSNSKNECDEVYDDSGHNESSYKTDFNTASGVRVFRVTRVMW